MSTCNRAWLKSEFPKVFLPPNIPKHSSVYGSLGWKPFRFRLLPTFESFERSPAVFRKIRRAPSTAAAKAGVYTLSEPVHSLEGLGEQTTKESFLQSPIQLCYSLWVENTKKVQVIYCKKEAVCF